MVEQGHNGAEVSRAGPGKNGATGMSELQERRHGARHLIIGEAVISGRERCKRKVSHPRMTDHITLHSIAARTPEIRIDVGYHQDTIVHVPADSVALDNIVIPPGEHDTIPN